MRHGFGAVLRQLAFLEHTAFRIELRIVICLHVERARPKPLDIFSARPQECRAGVLHLVDNLCMVAAEIAVHDIRPVQTLQLLPVARQTDIVAVGLREGFRQPRSISVRLRYCSGRISSSS